MSTLAPPPPDDDRRARLAPRAIGDCGPEEEPAFPSSWPPLVAAAMARRGSAPLRIFCDGTFDLFHFGHARALEQAKKAFPNVHLIVGCNSDLLTHRYKGRTVLTDLERYESLRHCKWVDEVVPNSPWILDDAFLEAHDIDFVAHDAMPYTMGATADSGGDIYGHLKTIGKFYETTRTGGISTSDIVTRIVRDYDAFVRRNVARGATMDELNLPTFKVRMLRKRRTVHLLLRKAVLPAAGVVVADAGDASGRHAAPRACTWDIRPDKNLALILSAGAAETRNHGRGRCQPHQTDTGE